MPYHIARAALHDFVDRQLTLVESTPLPTDVRDLVADEDLGDDELAASHAPDVAAPARPAQGSEA